MPDSLSPTGDRQESVSTVFGFDKQFRFTTWSAGLERLSGRSAGEVLGRVVFEVFPSLTGDSGREIFCRVLQGEAILRQHRPCLMPGSDEHVLFEFNLFPCFDADGTITGGVVSVRDTGKLHQEEELRESERRLREVLENIQLVAVMFDVRGRLTFCNDFLLWLSGWERDQVIGRNWFELFLPSDQRDVLKYIYFGMMSRESAPLHIEHAIQTRHGAQRLISWNNTLLRDRGGNIVGTTSIGEDITERKRMEEQLRQQLYFTTAITNNLGEGICALDREGRVTFMNPAAERILGWSRAEVLGRKLNEAIRFNGGDGAPLPAEERAVIDAFGAGVSRANYESSLTHKTGAVLPVL
ncbi:MAG: PAS domain S-box protein, partial [Pyrinomonadaceae bacterium]